MELSILKLKVFIEDFCGPLILFKYTEARPSPSSTETNLLSSSWQAEGPYTTWAWTGMNVFVISTWTMGDYVSIQ